jgi:biotin carboxyl carrier protein
MKLKAFVADAEHDVEITRVEDGYEVVVDGVTHRVDSTRCEGAYYSLIRDNVSYFVSVSEDQRDVFTVRHGGFSRDVRVVDPLAAAAQAHDEHSGRAEVAAVMPGRVVKVLVEEGQEVAKGQGLIVLEAMKMENEIAAPMEGVVTSVTVGDGEAVEAGQVLVVVG